MGRFAPKITRVRAEPAIHCQLSIVNCQLKNRVRVSRHSLHSQLYTLNSQLNFLSDGQRVSEKIRLRGHFLFALGLELCYLKRVLAAGDY